MTASDFAALARAEPGRATVYSLVPVVVAAVQLLAGLHHDVSLVFPALFAAALVTFAVAATRYHLAVYRTDELRRTG